GSAARQSGQKRKDQGSRAANENGRSGRRYRSKTSQDRQARREGYRASRRTHEGQGSQVMSRASAQGYSLRDLQSLLGIPRRILQGLVDAGFVKPTRGRRNEMRFGFRDVVLLRTAFQLRSAKIPARRIVQALERLRLDLPEELPLSGIRITAVGDAVAVKTGSDQWDANSGQFLLDFEVAELKGDVTFLDSSPSTKVSLTKQADDWYAL